MKRLAACLLAACASNVAVTRDAEDAPLPQPAEAHRRVCAMGDAGACVDLGNVYRVGKLVPRDPARAMQLYTRACELGHLMGCNNMGYMHSEGDGVARDLCRAFELYKRACDGGVWLGCTNLGDMHAKGECVQRDYARSVALHKDACEKGKVPLACSNYGFALEKGRAVEKDVARARELYVSACDGGAALGCNNLGVLYERGAGGLEKDPAMAAGFYRRACEDREGLGCANLAALYRAGRGVQRDAERAAALDKRACELGRESSCRKELPPECTGIVDWNDPQAPPPDDRARREVALISSGGALEGERREKVLDAAQARLAAQVKMPMIARAEVREAERLVRERRWSAAGPVCGQPPPLAAILAARHPNLVLATLGTSCFDTCLLSVYFDRAGSTDEAGLPDPLHASVRGDRDDAASWIAAAGALGTDAPLGGLAGVFGYGGLGGGNVFHAGGYSDDDPWLRIGPTLWGKDDVFTKCAPKGSVAVLRLAWTISPAGEPGDVKVDGPPEAAQCVADALRAIGWPCTRSGKPASVEATLCLGR